MKPDAIAVSAPKVAREGGFTLVELLMAVTIMGIIIVTLGFSVTEGFQNATESKLSIDRSILGDFAARYFAPDIASTAFGPGSVVTTSPPACGVAVTTVVDIQTSVNTVVSYGYESPDATTRSLVRSTCTGTVAGTLTFVDRRHLGTTDSTLTPTAACATTTSCSLTLTWTNPNTSITVSGTRWVNAPTSTTTTVP